MNSLLNKKQVKRFILAKFQNLRPGMPINRVSQDALDKIEARLRNWLVEEVKIHPTIGQTFRL